MAQYLKKKKKKRKKNRKKIKSKEVGPDLLSTLRERERERKGQGTASTSMELTDWPNLAPARDRGQRQRQQRAEQRSEGGWVG